ncbi:MAG TPA: sensor histidine kinase [Acidimicrobiia bacterium]|jgi:signal transduction histidine kinase
MPRTDYDEPRAAAATEPPSPGGFDERLALLLTAARWLNVMLGLVVLLRDDVARYQFAGPALLAAAALAYTVRGHQASMTVPTRYVALELAATAAAVLLTGGLSSPLVLAPAVPMLLAGYRFDERYSVVLAGIAIAVTSGAVVIQDDGSTSPRAAALVGVVYLICGALGAFTRRLVREIGAQRTEVLEELSRLEEANGLLVALHGLTQTMPATLDLDEVMMSVRNRLDSSFSHSALCVLVRNAATGHWQPEIAEGARIAGALRDEELPAPLRTSIEDRHVVRVDDYLRESFQGVSSFARSGMYGALWARGQVVGLIAVEHNEPRQYTVAEAQRLNALRESVALQLDNALWFGRLKTLGAETERARIARDLHDRIAQSLAYVGFELERHAVGGKPAGPDVLTELREVIHGVVIELRDTLYDLRARVTDDEPFEDVARRYLERFEDRYDIDVDFRSRSDHRLPVSVEQELWRILQEGLQNVARHADAGRVEIDFSVHSKSASLEVRDDGCGFVPLGVPGDRFGLMGMRERADAIGAQLRIDSRLGHGTVIRVEMEVAA